MKYAVAAVLAGALWVAGAAPASAATISGQAPASVRVFGVLNVTATVAGGTPAGTVEFALFGPDDPNCTGSGTPSGPKPLQDGVAAATFSTSAAGLHRVVATSSDGPSTGCNAPGLITNVTRYAPTLGPSAPVTAAAGQALTQTQTLAAAFNPTGTIVFDLYGPDDPGCARARVFTSTKALAPGGGTYTSDAFSVKAAGAYRWRATYGGDQYNDPAVATSCLSVLPPDKTRPVLGTPTLSPSRFRAGKRTTIRYSLSEAATVVFGVEQARTGRRSGKRCVAPTGKNRGKRKCRRYVVLKGSFSHKGAKGSNRLTFNGKLRGRKLARGNYRLRAVATDAARTTRALKLRAFKILR